MNAHLAAFLDADLNTRIQVELWLAGLGMVAVGWLVQRLVGHVDTLEKGLHLLIRRTDRHEVTIVDDLRDGKPYPSLSQEE